MPTTRTLEALSDIFNYYIAAAHDDSIGELMCSTAEDACDDLSTFDNFLQKILQTRSWKKGKKYDVKVVNGSSCQDANADEYITIMRTKKKGKQLFFNGTIFIGFEALVKRLQNQLNKILPKETTTTVSFSTVMTADLFLEDLKPTLLNSYRALGKLLLRLTPPPPTSYYDLMKEMMRAYYQHKKNLPLKHW